MAQWKERSRRKASGGMFRDYRKKKVRDTGKDPVYTKLGKDSKSRQSRVTGGDVITSLLIASHANIASRGKIKKEKILTVVENTASRNFVRQGIITKGTVIKVSSGLARVTSKPTKDGIVNAILLK